MHTDSPETSVAVVADAQPSTGLRRRLIGAGLIGLAGSLVPRLAAAVRRVHRHHDGRRAAATTTTAPPKRPTEADVGAARFAQSVSSWPPSSCMRWRLASGSLTDEAHGIVASVHAVARVVRPSPERLAGPPGARRPAGRPGRLDVAEAFGGDQQSIPRPRTSSRTRSSPRTPRRSAQLRGHRRRRAASPRILIVEARHSLVFADLAGVTDLDALIFTDAERDRTRGRVSHVTHRMNDEVRRALRTMGATADAEHRAMGTAMQAMFESPTTPAATTHAMLGRRRFLQIGGFGVATAAVLAACGGNEGGGLARVGNAPTTTAAARRRSSTTCVLLRTASSLEHSAISVYDLVIGNADLLDPKYDDVAKRFRDDHAGHAALFEKLTKDIGGEPWTCSNPRIDEFVIGPGPRSRSTARRPPRTLPRSKPTDDPKRDVLNFAHGLESLAGATYQALVPSRCRRRRCARRRSPSAPTRSGTRRCWHWSSPVAPTATCPPAEAPADPPKIPVVYAIPSAYGLLGRTAGGPRRRERVGRAHDVQPRHPQPEHLRLRVHDRPAC